MRNKATTLIVGDIRETFFYSVDKEYSLRLTSKVDEKHFNKNVLLILIKINGSWESPSNFEYFIFYFHFVYRDPKYPIGKGIRIRIRNKLGEYENTVFLSDTRFRRSIW